MALSDTAALVASLELKDQFSATANKFDRTVGGMERRVSTFGKISQQVGSGISSGVQNLQRLALVGVGVIGANVAAGIQSLIRLEEVTAATNAVVESTGGVAGITAAKVRDLAEAYESINATMDDKVIQSAENVLLTFTSIGKDAFPLALEAALNMNQALGGGEEGLQGTIIQVGKALQDPIKGITALRRVGVNFSSAQQDTIRALVEENKLFEAQQLILKELNTEFGGQFAAAGDTQAARWAKFKDAIEDTQMALATALLPALDKVSVKLTELLADPATQAAIVEVGENLADAFDSLVEVAGNLPWESIGHAFELMGTGSKALLDAFVKLPPWVQTAVITGWGLNKLTGGALSGIVGTLASGLIRGVLGITAGVVNIKAGAVTGGGAPAGGGGIGGLATGLIGGAAVGGAVVGGISALEQISSGTEEGVKSGFAAISGGFAGLIAEAVESVIGDPLGDLVDGQEAGVLTVAGAVDKNTAANAVTSGHLIRGVDDNLANGARQVAIARTLQQADAVAEAARRRDATSSLQRLTAAGAKLDTIGSGITQAKKTALDQLREQATANQRLLSIANKNFSPTVNVTTHVVSNVTISELQRKITSQQIAVGTGPLEF